MTRPLASARAVSVATVSCSGGLGCAPRGARVTTSPARSATLVRKAPAVTGTASTRATTSPPRRTVTPIDVVSCSPVPDRRPSDGEASITGGAAGPGRPAVTPATRVSRFAPSSTKKRSPLGEASGESVRLRRAAGRKDRPGAQSARAPPAFTVPIWSPYSSLQMIVFERSTTRSAGTASPPNSFTGTVISVMPCVVPGTARSGSSAPTLPVADSVNQMRPLRSRAIECGTD